MKGKKLSFTGGRPEKELFSALRRGGVGGSPWAERSLILPGNEDSPSGLLSEKGQAGARIKDLTPIFGDLRWAKSAKEIEIMKKACAITAEAFKESARIAKPGVWEYQIEALCDYVFRRDGCDGNAFLIIGSGPNSVILHHSSNDRQMKDGDLAVLDIGAIYHAATTDLTRTIPVSGVYSPEQKKVYTVVLEAQKKAISMVRPGVTLAQLHDAAMGVIAKAGYGKYFIHFLSHTLFGGVADKRSSLGLSNPARLSDKPLEPGCMFTIEPGIYIPEKGLGVRIEDDILVTADGCEILTKDAPKEIDEIEKLMKERPVILIK
jgi:Xaa-Pro aminopeptidase